MARKWYGSICNRIAEGRIRTEDGLIHKGDDITMYYWSDRSCYFVTKVIDQKHIFVKPYEVVADRSKPGGMGHQDWLYFKSRREANMYLNEFMKEEDKYPVDELVEAKEEEWVLRYGKWNRVVGTDENGKPIYRHLSGQITIGVRDYYYDWEF